MKDETEATKNAAGDGGGGRNGQDNQAEHDRSEETLPKFLIYI